MAAAVEAKEIIGIYGRRIPVDDVIKSLTTGDNEKILGRMWTLTRYIDREVGCAIYDNGEEIYLANFAIGSEVTVSISTEYRGQGVAIGTAHTHPGQSEPKHSSTDIKNLLSRGYPGGVSIVIAGFPLVSWKAPAPKAAILFLTADVIESELYYAYVEGGWWVDGEWRDFSDEDYQKLVSQLTRIEIDITPYGIPTTYFCDICHRRHKISSGIGRWHIDRAINQLLLGEVE
jgi:proteasome lid subunit RPN8/RPN11